jgi:excinuclease UvrABC nuclease subunit
MEITELPQVSVQERHRLPTASGVYFVLSKCGEILYVGRAKNLRSRWRNHHLRHPDWTIAYLEAPLSVLRELETGLIRRFLPRLNKQHRHSVYRVLTYRQRLLSC